jgi:RES domain-containing protein
VIDLWRLYRRPHGPGLDGAGGLQVAGRWHALGSPVVYFGASASVVILEKLAHIEARFLPDDLVLGRFAGELSIEDLRAGAIEDFGDVAQTRARGQRFLTERTACVLRVPSVIVPEDTNLVFNPLHPEAPKIEQVSARPFTFDGRLL